MDLITAQTFNRQKASNSDWKKKLLVAIFAILAVVVLVELAWAATILLTPVSNKVEKFPKIEGGQITLIAPEKDYKLGDSIEVTVGVSTGESVTDGTDVVIKYDPKVLEASSGAFEKGTIYSEYPNIKVDSQDGLIQLSGISSTAGQGFQGVGVFGRLNFKTKAQGSTTLSVDFVKNATHESNIVENQSGKDVLVGVSNLNLNIK